MNTQFFHEDGNMNQSVEVQQLINEAVKAERVRIAAALQAIEAQGEVVEDYANQTLWIALHEVECVVNNGDLAELRTRHSETVAALKADYSTVS